MFKIISNINSMLERNIKYKQQVRIQLYGDDDIYANATSSTYQSPYYPSVNISNGGSGYGTEAPILSFIGGGGVNLQEVATLSAGVVTGITVTNKGHNYSSAPPQLFKKKHSTVGTLNTITITNAGAGYPNNTIFPLVFTGCGGFEATGYVQTSGTGTIGTVTISTKGYNYTSAPTVTIYLSSLIAPPTTVAVLTATINGTLATLTATGPTTNGKRILLGF